MSSTAKNKKILAAIVVVIVVVAGIGVYWATLPAPTPPKPEAKPVKLGFAVGPAGQASYIRGAAMADVIAKAFPAGSTVDLVVGGGYLTFPAVVNKGDADMSVSTAVSLMWAAAGTGPFKEKLGKQTNLRVIATELEPSYVFFVVRKEVPLDTIEDLKTKKYPLKLMTLQVGSEGEYIVGELLQVLMGITYSDIKSWGGSVDHGSWETIAPAIKDGTKEAMAGVIPLKHATLTEVCISIPMKFLPMSKSGIEKMVGLGGYAEAVLPAKSFQGIDKDVPTVVESLIMFVRADLSDDVAYTITKAIIENKDKIVTAVPSMKDWKLESSMKNSPIQLHSGAIKYYKERGWM